MKFELDLTPQEVETLRVTLEHYKHVAWEDSRDYEHGSAPEVFHKNGFEVMTALSSELTRQGSPPSFSIENQGNNVIAELRSPYGIWTREPAQLNEIRQALLTHPDLHKVLDRGNKDHPKDRDSYPNVSDAVWNEQDGVVQIVAADLGLPNDLNKKDLSFAELREPDRSLNYDKATQRQSFDADRIDNALKHKDPYSTYIRVASNGVKLALESEDGVVSVHRVHADDEASWRYRSHREIKGTYVPSIRNQMDGEERDALLETLQALELEQEQERINALPAMEEIREKFAEGFEEFKQSAPDLGDPGSAKERIDRNLQILKDTVDSLKPAYDHQYFPDDKQNLILNGIPVKDQDKATEMLQFAANAASRADERPYDEAIANAFNGVGGNTLDALRDSLDPVTQEVYGRGDGNEDRGQFQDLNHDKLPELPQLFAKADQIMDKPLYKAPQLSASNAELFTAASQHALDNGTSQDNRLFASLPDFDVAINPDGTELTIAKDTPEGLEFAFDMKDADKNPRHDTLTTHQKGQVVAQVHYQRQLAKGIPPQQLQAQIDYLSNQMSRHEEGTPQHEAASRMRSAIAGVDQAQQYRKAAAQPPHPDLDLFTNMMDVTDIHGSGDYGIDDLYIGDGYTIRSHYSGGSLMQGNDTVVSFESPYAENGGLSHPIVVKGQLNTEQRRFVQQKLEQYRDEPQITLPQDSRTKALEPEQPSIFAMVDEGMKSPEKTIDLDSVDAVIARDMFGHCTEISGPGNDNTLFFNQVEAAVAVFGTTDPRTGIRSLDIGGNLTALSEQGQVVIGFGDSRDTKRVVYAQSKGTSHLGGTGEHYTDKISPQQKKALRTSIAQQVQGLRTPTSPLEVTRLTPQHSSEKKDVERYF